MTTTKTIESMIANALNPAPIPFGHIRRLAVVDAEETYRARVREGRDTASALADLVAAHARCPEHGSIRV